MQPSQTNNFEIFDASKFKVGIVCAQFNSDITGEILALALGKLKNYQVKNNSITVCRVAGSVEVPVVLAALAKTKKYNCLIAIGAIIRGQTDHYDYVAKIVTDGVLRVSLDYNLPIGFGVLTTSNKKLAQARVDIGAQAVSAALHSVKVIFSVTH